MSKIPGLPNSVELVSDLPEQHMPSITKNGPRHELLWSDCGVASLVHGFSLRLRGVVAIKKGMIQKGVEDTFFRTGDRLHLDETTTIHLIPDMYGVVEVNLYVI